MSPRSLLGSLAGFGLTLFASTPSAEAHIRLLDPVARYEITGFDTGIKSCPCGLGESNRTCDVQRDGSDPDRAMARVSRFEAGSTITLRFEEYVDHVGSFRVAFDNDGADLADFNSDILVPFVADPSGGVGNVGEGDIWEIEVRLPDMTCDNCTLQLVQAMNGDTTNAVADPATTSAYYACVDLQLVAPGTLDDPPPDDGMEATDPNEGGMMGSAGMGTAGASSTSGSGNGGTGATIGNVPSDPENPSMQQGTPIGGIGMNGNMTSNPMSGSTNQPPGLTLDGLMGNNSNSSASSGGCNLGANEPVESFASIAVAGALGALVLRKRTRR